MQEERKEQKEKQLQEEKQLQKRADLIAPDIKDLSKGVYGNVDFVNQDGVFGWIVDLDSPEQPILELYLDDKKVAETSPSIKREDIVKIFNKEIVAGFEFHWTKLQIPEELKNKKVKVKVVHQRTGMPLAPGEVEFDLSLLEKEEPEYIGSLDAVKGFYVYGWAYNRKNPEERVEVVVLVDGKPVAEGVADLFRQDLLDAGIGDGKHGFRIRIPDEMFDGKNHKIEFLVEGRKIKEGTDSLTTKLNHPFSEIYRIDIKRKYEKKKFEKDRLSKEENVRIIAFYLPQFYPFQENNEWWGEGFTEWAQIVSAKPYFKDHYQPRLPADLGFYDLRIREVRKKQEELAKKYGIYGFCYYYYWFSGKTIMDEVLKDILQSGIPDLPFCLCWANEPWTRRWDGSDNEVLMPQPHILEIDETFILDLLPFFKDDRYIKVYDKPMLIVYNPRRIPNTRHLFSAWREIAKDKGFPGLHIVIAETFGASDPFKYGADAAVEFPPHKVSSPEITSSVLQNDDKFEGHIFDYREVVAREIVKLPPNYPLYRTVMTGWDNTPRRGTKAHIFYHFTPEYFEIWLRHVIYYTIKNFPAEERFVFINAWNEWAEGTYLEPDRKYGHTLLQAVSKAKSKNISPYSVIAELELFLGNNEKALEILNYLKRYLNNIERIYDFVISYIESLTYMNWQKPIYIKLEKEKIIALDTRQLNFRYNIEAINQYSINEIKKQKKLEIFTNKIVIYGWAYCFDPNFHSNFYIILTDGENSYLFPIKNRNLRSDVNQVLNLSDKVMVGFKENLLIEDIPQGKYKLQLAFSDDNSWIIADTEIFLLLGVNYQKIGIKHERPPEQGT
uniref:Uncharacterized protein n=1 Tax=Thermodesulfobacterium geofontis TaxID=1295609 RepID=A0A7V6CEB0_9BACT